MGGSITKKRGELRYRFKGLMTILLAFAIFVSGVKLPGMEEAFIKVVKAAAVIVDKPDSFLAGATGLHVRITGAENPGAVYFFEGNFDVSDEDTWNDIITNQSRDATGVIDFNFNAPPDSGYRYDYYDTTELDVLKEYIFYKRTQNNPAPAPAPVAKADDDDDEEEEDEGSRGGNKIPLYVNPLKWKYPANQPKSLCFMEIQGDACRYAFTAAKPAGYSEAFTFNLILDNKYGYDAKKGTLELTYPLEYIKEGRTFAMIIIDKNGNTKVLPDLDDKDDTITVDVDGYEGFAFDLIYKD